MSAKVLKKVTSDVEEEAFEMKCTFEMKRDDHEEKELGLRKNEWNGIWKERVQESEQP